MEAITSLHSDFGSEARRFGRFLLGELKPKGRVLTPFNVITSALILATAVLLAIRFSTTILSSPFLVMSSGSMNTDVSSSGTCSSAALTKSRKRGVCKKNSWQG